MAPSERFQHPSVNAGVPRVEVSLRASSMRDEDLTVAIARNDQQILHVESRLQVVTGRLDEWSKMIPDLQAGLMDLRRRQAIDDTKTQFGNSLQVKEDSTDTFGRGPISRTLSKDAAPSEHSGSLDVSHRCLSSVSHRDPLEGHKVEDTQVSGLVASRFAECESRMAARCAAVEAICQDLRCSLQDLASVPQATAELAKVELMGELHQLRERFRAECLQGELRSADIKGSVEVAVSSHSQRLDALESAATDTAQRLSEAEASCQDLRCSLKEMKSAPEVTAEMTKAELRVELHQLREQLLAECLQTELRSADVTRFSVGSVDLAVSSVSQRLDALELGTRRSGESNTDVTCAQREPGIRLHEQHGDVRSLRELVEKKDALLTECLTILSDAASTAGTGSEAAAVLAQQLSAVREEQRATAGAVTLVSESVAEASAASIRRAEEGISAKLSGTCLENSVTPMATSTGVGASNLSHQQASTSDCVENCKIARMDMEAAISACIEDCKIAQADMEDMKKRTLALEKAVCWATLNTPSVRQSTDAEAVAPLSSSHQSSQQSAFQQPITTIAEIGVARQCVHSPSRCSTGYVAAPNSEDGNNGSKLPPEADAPNLCNCSPQRMGRARAWTPPSPLVRRTATSSTTSSSMHAACLPVSAPVRMASAPSSGPAVQASALARVASPHTSDAQSSSDGVGVQGREMRRAQSPTLTARIQKHLPVVAHTAPDSVSSPSTESAHIPMAQRCRSRGIISVSTCSRQSAGGSSSLGPPACMIRRTVCRQAEHATATMPAG